MVAAFVALCVEHNEIGDMGKPVISASERARIRGTSSHLIPVGNASDDPVEALRSISMLPEGERSSLELQMIKDWGGRDFDAARDWVLASGSASRHDLLVTLGRSAIRSRPLDAMKLADGITDERARLSFFSTMVQTWASTDTEAAAGWVGHCDPLFKEEVQMALVVEIAQNDPPASARYVAVEMESGGVQDQAALTVAARWACLDPQAARSWALSLPESDLQQRVLIAVDSLSKP